MFPHASWLVWMLPAFSSLLIPLIARLNAKVRDCFAVIVSLTALALAFSMVPDVYFGILESFDSMPWIPSMAINVGVCIDSLSVLFACVVTFFGFIIIVYSFGYMAGEEGLTRYYFFILLFIGSMVGLVMSDNFLQMFIFWELVGLCSYSLVSFWYKRLEAVRSGAKVFLMTRIGDVSFLAGICLLYMQSGSLSFSHIVGNITHVPLPVLTVIVFLMLIGAIAKSAQLPLHTWLYSAMEAPTSVSALLHSATMVKAGVYLIARLILIFGELTAYIPMWLPSILWIGTITAFIGATLAISTTDIKGVAAYSTISQIGFMFAALGTACSPSSPGWFAGLLHLVSHALFQGLDFLLIGGIVHATKTRDMRLMGGLRKAMPVTFRLSLIVMLSRVGIPPVISFFSKELIIQSILSSGNLHAALILYASTALTFAYTLRAITLVYMREKPYCLRHIHESPKIMLIPAGALAALCILTGFFVNSFSHLLHVENEVGLNDVLSLSTLSLLLVLFMGGISVYLAYYRKPSLLEHAKKTFYALNKILENGYFIDAFYEKIIAEGVLLASKSLIKIEAAFFNTLPYLVVRGVMRLAYDTQKYLDVFADELLYLVAGKALASASKIKGLDSHSIEHYITAVVIGFLIILILAIVTMLLM